MRSIPTLKELYDGVLADLQTTFSITIPVFGKNFLRALASVQAGKLKLIYLSVGLTQKNIFVDTAESESIGGTLERFGRVKLGRNPFSATSGQYTVQVTGTAGAVIRQSMTFKSDDNSLNPGKLFILDEEFTLTDVTDVITLRALEGGIDSKLLVSDTLTATEPIANVNKQCSVLTEAIEPRAAEDIEEYRFKALQSYRLEAQGGAPTDYRLWSYDAQGVKQTYPYAKSGVVCEVNLYVEASVIDSIDGKGTPSPALLAEIEQVIEFNPDTSLPLLERGRRPIGTFQVHYLPVTVKYIDIVINGYNGLTSGIESSILTSLTNEINLIRPFVAGIDILDERNDVLDINKIISIILTAKPGSIFSGITLSVETLELNTFTFTNGDIPYLNSVTYAV